jgi:hypothetical protein
MRSFVVVVSMLALAVAGGAAAAQPYPSKPMKSESVKWARVIKEAGIRVE